MDYIAWARMSRKARDRGKALCKEYGYDLTEEIVQHLGAFALTVEGGYSGKAVQQWCKYAQLASLPPIKMTGINDNKFEFCGKLFELVGV